MITTINEILEDYKGMYDKLEIYQAVAPNQQETYRASLMKEPVREISYDEPLPIAYYNRLLEKDYNEEVLEDKDDKLDFSKLYDSRTPCVLIIVLESCFGKETL